MSLTDDQRQDIQQTIATPGWEVIVKMAHDRVRAAKEAALLNNDETRFLELYRKAHAAHDALVEFIYQLDLT